MSCDKKKSSRKASTNNVDNTSVIDVQEMSVVPFLLLTVQPKFPKSDKFVVNNFSKNLKSFVADNFNKNVVGLASFKSEKTKDIAEPGQIKMLVRFIINQHGAILAVNVKAPHPKLKAEAIRVIESLPKFTPGEVKGRKVSVKYSLPITFNIND